MREWTEDRRAKMRARFVAKCNESCVDSAGELVNTLRERNQRHWDRVTARHLLGGPLADGWTIGRVAKRIGRSRGMVKRLVGPVDVLVREHRAQMALVEQAFPKVEVEVEVESEGKSRRGEIPRRARNDRGKGKE